MKFTYLIVDLLAVLVPFLFSFHRKIKFYRQFPPFLCANFLSAICFIIWDRVFTRNGTWGFNADYITGIRLLDLPIEEVLFFFCIPFSCVFTYYCLNSFYGKPKNTKTTAIFTYFLAAMLLFLGFAFLRHAYTATTFLSTAVLLLLSRIVFNEDSLPSIYRAWALLLIPFCIVNGILTGTGLSSPIVWYNDAQTMGARVFTIPIEDFVYGFELVMVTVVFYEFLKNIFNQRGELAPGAIHPAARNVSTNRS